MYRNRNRKQCTRVPILGILVPLVEGAPLKLPSKIPMGFLLSLRFALSATPPLGTQIHKTTYVRNNHSCSVKHGAGVIVFGNFFHDTPTPYFEAWGLLRETRSEQVGLDPHSLSTVTLHFEYYLHSYTSKSTRSSLISTSATKLIGIWAEIFFTISNLCVLVGLSCW